MKVDFYEISDHTFPIRDIVLRKIINWTLTFCCGNYAVNTFNPIFSAFFNTKERADS